ncbi:MAG TPA: thiamine phosphate synthase [Gemmatimonadales bacterium]
MPPDLRLIAIVDPAILAGRDLVEAAREAVTGGATVIQLRMKAASAAECYRAASALVGAVSAPVYVNDRADVAWAAGAAGVHVGADDLPPAPLRSLTAAPFAIGVSVGSPKEAAAVGDAAVDYWSIGPVFRTSSKDDAGDAIGVAGWRALAARAPSAMPVVAIGGIGASNAGEVIRAGGAGVAVIRAVFASRDIRRAAQAIRDAVDAARHCPPAG